MKKLIMMLGFLLVVLTMHAQTQLQKNAKGELRAKPSVEDWNDIPITITDEALPYIAFADSAIAHQGDTIVCLSDSVIPRSFLGTQGLFKMRRLAVVRGIVCRGDIVSLTQSYARVSTYWNVPLFTCLLWVIAVFVLVLPNDDPWVSKPNYFELITAGIFTAFVAFFICVSAPLLHAIIVLAASVFAFIRIITYWVKYISPRKVFERIYTISSIGYFVLMLVYVICMYAA